MYQSLVLGLTYAIASVAQVNYDKVKYQRNVELSWYNGKIKV